MDKMSSREDVQAVAGAVSACFGAVVAAGIAVSALAALCAWRKLARRSASRRK